MRVNGDFQPVDRCILEMIEDSHVGSYNRRLIANHIRAFSGTNYDYRNIPPALCSIFAARCVELNEGRRPILSPKIDPGLLFQQCIDHGNILKMVQDTILTMADR